MSDVVKMLPVAGTVEFEPMIFCPACRRGHVFHVSAINPENHRWTWNGDRVKPTFSPSLLVHETEGVGPRCHSVVTGGTIAFQQDCGHEMRGQSAVLGPVPDEW